MVKASATFQSFLLGIQDPCKNPLLRSKAMRRLCNNNFLLSLVVAFFVVFICTQILNLTYQGLEGVDKALIRDNNKSLYMMERG